MAYFYAELNEENICVGVGRYPVEIEDDKFIEINGVDTKLLGCKYEDGIWSKVEQVEVDVEPTEAEIIQAEILLNQMTMLENQANQDAVLAEILLNQMEG